MFILQALQNPIYLLEIAVALIVSITVHEYAHAWVAYKLGDPTAKMEGRLTLNPLAHLDPLGTIMMFLVGFGWGKPVPYNPNFFHKKSDELKVAFAGIAMNIILALILAIPLRIALLSGHLVDSSPVLTFLNTIVDINILLATFNLIPLSPLDGSHLVEYFLSENAIESYQMIGPYVLIGLIIIERTTNTSILFAFMEPVMRALSLLIKGVYTNI